MTAQVEIEFKPINKEGKAHAGNATQNIHPAFMQKTRLHIQPHTASFIHLQVTNTRDTYTKQR